MTKLGSHTSHLPKKVIKLKSRLAKAGKTKMALGPRETPSSARVLLLISQNSYGRTLSPMSGNFLLPVVCLISENRE